LAHGLHLRGIKWKSLQFDQEDKAFECQRKGGPPLTIEGREEEAAELDSSKR
jgi:hypothetical protein